MRKSVEASLCLHSIKATSVPDHLRAVEKGGADAELRTRRAVIEGGPTQAKTWATRQQVEVWRETACAERDHTVPVA